MNKPVVRKLRCAVYTRKSSEEGLEQEFNSLHAQREACESYIASQRSEGWVLVRDQYDDGGISGGTLERPGLKRLLADIEDGLVDVVVVYKIDRLSRSLMDFSKLVEVFDRNGVTFVSVTQSFNTTTSMGRLTLNILLSFAQFEREVTAERIRDKVRASRMKGMWMGGCPPLGYEVKDRKLVENSADAAHVRWVFARFIEIGSGTLLARELAERGVTTSRGHRIDKKFIYRMLNNRVYIGEAVHKGDSYPGEHDAIIDRAAWDKVHSILTESPRKRAARTRADTPALLKGLLYGPDGAAFSPTHTRKSGKLYRYYVSQSVLKHGAGSCAVGRVPAGEIETAVIDQLRAVFRQPEIVAGTWKAARAQDGEITEANAHAALQQLNPLWDELFPAEQARIVGLAIERVDIAVDSVNVRLRMDGLSGLAREMLAGDVGVTESRDDPFSKLLSQHFKLVDELGKFRNLAGPISHGKRGFAHKLSSHHRRAAVLAADALVTFLHEAYLEMEPDPTVTLEPYERFRSGNALIDKHAAMNADIDDDGFLNITVGLPNDDEIPLTISASQLLFGTDREAYKQAVNACKEADSAPKPEDEEAA